VIVLCEVEITILSLSAEMDFGSERARTTTFLQSAPRGLINVNLLEWFRLGPLIGVHNRCEVTVLVVVTCEVKEVVNRVITHCSYVFFARNVSNIS